MINVIHVHVRPGSLSIVKGPGLDDLENTLYYNAWLHILSYNYLTAFSLSKAPHHQTIFLKDFPQVDFYMFNIS